MRLTFQILNVLSWQGSPEELATDVIPRILGKGLNSTFAVGVFHELSMKVQGKIIIIYCYTDT